MITRDTIVGFVFKTFLTFFIFYFMYKNKKQKKNTIVNNHLNS